MSNINIIVSKQFPEMPQCIINDTKKLIHDDFKNNKQLEFSGFFKNAF